MSRNIIVQVFFLISTLGFCCGCGESPPDRKETCKVTGQVLVDGKPAESLEIKCHDKAGLDKEMPTESSCLTDKEGRFQFNTYQLGDGVPPGEYRLTFVWGQIDMMSMHYGGPDKLNGRYDHKKPLESKFSFTVESGEEEDLGTIELTTK